MVDRALRICLVSQSYLPYHGGITEHVWHLAAFLCARGHHVTVLTGNPLQGNHSPDPDPPGVRVLRVGRTVRVPSNGARACVTLGWRWGAKIGRLLRQPSDLVHIHSPLEPFLPLWTLGNLPGTKIGTFHTGGEKLHWGYQGFAHWLLPFSRRLTRRLAVSRTAARFVSRHFPGHYEVIPNGVDPSRFYPPQVPRGKGQRPEIQILFVGRLDPRKGLCTLLDAFTRLRRARVLRGSGKPGSGIQGAGRMARRLQFTKNLRLVIVGDGPERPRLERLARDRRLPVAFLGSSSRRDLPERYRQADVFVAPSADGESFGVSLLEAMASGLPIVAAGIPGYRETLEGSKAAVFFRPGCAEALARALEQLLDDAERRGHMGCEARRFVHRYSWDRVADRIEQIYFECLARQDQSGRPCWPPPGRVPNGHSISAVRSPG